MSLDRFFFCLGAILILLAPAPASATDMCAKGEPNDVCALHEQRDFAMDQVAKAEGARRDEIAVRDREKEYWRQYVQGLPDVPALEKHVKAVCAWRGTQSKPSGELCAWWDSMQPKPYVRNSK